MTGKRPPTRKNISEGHPLDHLTEIELKTRHFAHGALSPLSPLRWSSGQVYFVLIFPSCNASLLASTEATPLLSAWTQPRYPGARALRALRRQSSRQLLTEPSLKAKRPAPAGQRWGWRPLRAAGEERAAPRSQTSEGSPRSSSAVSARTGSPN